MLKWANMQGKEPLKRKTKVCYVITKGNWGGAQKYVYSLATSLPKEKYEVVVITGEGKVLREKLERKEVRVYEIENLKRDISLKLEIKSFWKLFKIVAKERPDVLHLNSPKAGGLGGLVGKILFIKKIIYTAHGWTFNEERGIFDQTLVALLSWMTIILSHKTIVIASREEKQALAMPLINQNKIVLIRNGIEQIVFKEKDESRKEILHRIGKENIPQTLWIGTISELHKNKGLEYVLEAVSKIQTPFIFFIIGNGEEKTKLQNLIIRYNLEEKVFLLGFLEKANEYLKAFDIFILTSIKEGLPYTILEAGLASLPVIASNIGGIPDILENGTSGILVTKGRPGEITRALEYMIDKPAEKKSFGKKLKEKVEKEFSIEQMLEETRKIYDAK